MYCRSQWKLLEMRMVMDGCSSGAGWKLLELQSVSEPGLCCGREERAEVTCRQRRLLLPLPPHSYLHPGIGNSRGGVNGKFTGVHISTPFIDHLEPE
ncbi:hypothetical protein NDU88_000300 [Pleurodeles waltl]|uniref:Uncharacterized protein n=1 Tax=Pleurodeles waltl TaxID=8319 RepID=A0AAV7LU83_PLEWA|nr:hypothetical protein NDU88_000300 [Pleurodeles waltl]